MSKIICNFRCRAAQFLLPGSMSSLAVTDALKNFNINSGYIHLIGNIYKEATAKLKQHKTTNEFNITKGIK